MVTENKDEKENWLLPDGGLLFQINSKHIMVFVIPVVEHWLDGQTVT